MLSHTTLPHAAKSQGSYDKVARCFDIADVFDVVESRDFVACDNVASGFGAGVDGSL